MHQKVEAKTTRYMIPNVSSIFNALIQPMKIFFRVALYWKTAHSDRSILKISLSKFYVAVVNLCLAVKLFLVVDFPFLSLD
jgi:hypothetical protein